MYSTLMEPSDNMFNGPSNPSRFHWAIKNWYLIAYAFNLYQKRRAQEPFVLQPPSTYSAKIQTTQNYHLISACNGSQFNIHNNISGRRDAIWHLGVEHPTNNSKFAIYCNPGPHCCVVPSLHFLVIVSPCLSIFKNLPHIYISGV